MIGYLDLVSGISGDMFLGCLVDAGWPIERLREVLSRLGLPAGSWSVEAADVMKGAIRAKRVKVEVAEGDDAHHHRHAETPPAAKPHTHDHSDPHSHSHAHGHAPAATPAPKAPGHQHGHRNLHDVKHIIHDADLPAAVKDRAIAVFSRLAAAEAKVHGTTIDKVHFHEVGALDAIVDIVGASAGIADLGLARLYASAVPLGSGWINTAHGRLPVPAPATAELLASVSAPTCTGPGEGELVTPTGAAILAEFATFSRPVMRISRVAIGAGGRDCAWPNIVRLCLGELDAADTTTAAGQVVELQTNIDDMNPQLYNAVCERLLAAGALDVWLTPVQMKKGRPGVVLAVLAEPSDERALADMLLAETTTLGVRVQRMDRHVAGRQMREIQTPWGPVRCKLKLLGAKVHSAQPEFDDCARLAAESQVPVKTVYEAAFSAAVAMIQLAGE